MKKVFTIGIVLVLVCFVMGSVAWSQTDPLKQKYDFALDDYNNGENTSDPAAKDKYFDSAMAKFREIVGEDPNYTPAWYHIGLIHYKRNQFSEAIEPLMNVTKVDTTVSTLAACNFYVGLCYTKLDQPESALEPFQNALALEPNNLNYIYQIAETFQDLGQSDQAIPYFEQIIEKDPQGDLAKSASFFVRGHYYETRQYDKALAVCEEIAKVNPDDVDNNIIIGSIYQIKRDNDSAIRAFSNVIAVDPEKCQILDRLGSLWFQKQNLDKSLEYYQKAETCGEGDYLRYYSWGRALFTKGDLEGAIAKFEKTVELNADYADAYAYKSKAELQMQQYETALASINKAINIEPGAFLYATRGEIYAKLHKIPEDPLEQIDYLEKAKADFKRAQSDRNYKDFAAQYIDFCDKSIEIIKEQNIIIDD